MRGENRGLSELQKNLQSLEIAWWFWLGDARPPDLPLACAWLRDYPLSDILTLIERVSQRDDIENPCAYIGVTLRRDKTCVSRNSEMTAK